MSIEPVQLERRCGQRFQLHFPLTISMSGRVVHGYAQDVSARGLSIVAELSVAVGDAVELIFTMPSEVTLGQSMRVRAQARVLRASASSAAPGGIAVRLDSYQHLPSPECESASEPAPVSASPATDPRVSAGFP